MSPRRRIEANPQRLPRKGATEELAVFVPPCKNIGPGAETVSQTRTKAKTLSADLTDG
jgi:hypothetical protein